MVGSRDGDGSFLSLRRRERPRFVALDFPATGRREKQSDPSESSDATPQMRMPFSASAAMRSGAYPSRVSST